jgi:membrane protease YdiL (CAAX protease family)
LPRTGTERWLAVGVAITAGIAEELMFRGLLIAAAVGIVGLPIGWAALLAAVLFALSHLYQGPTFVLPALVGLSFTVLYLSCGSLLPGMVAHIAMDVAALTIPARVVTGAAPRPVAAPWEPAAGPEPSPVPASGSSTPSTVSSPVAVRPPYPQS